MTVIRGDCTQRQLPTAADWLLINVSAQRTLNRTGFPPHMTQGKRDRWHIFDPDGPQAEALRMVQASIARLSPAIASPMRWLATMAVSTKVAALFRSAVTHLRQLDWYVHHYDAHNSSDEKFLELFARQAWYRDAPIIHRTFRIRHGCKVEAWAYVTRWLVTSHGARARSNSLYTHVWFIDSDMDFRYFDLEAYQALVAHTAPFLSQPGVMATRKGGRSSDYYSLKAGMARAVIGRERSCTQLAPVENNLVLVDARLLAAFADCVSLIAADLAADKAKQNAINSLGLMAAKWSAANATPNAAPYRRPPGMVFDYVPVLHMASVSLPPKGKLPTSSSTTRCLRGGGNSSAVYGWIRANTERLKESLKPACPWAWEYL